MSTDERELGALALRAGEELGRVTRRFAVETGLFAGQPKVLAALLEHEGCTLSALSRHCGTGMSSLSVSLRSLESAGLIVKEIRGRSSRLYLTGPGREKIKDYQALTGRFFADMLASLGQEKGDALAGALGDLTDYLQGTDKW